MEKGIFNFLARIGIPVFSKMGLATSSKVFADEPPVLRDMCVVYEMLCRNVEDYTMCSIHVGSTRIVTGI